jgi:hypothetical protein
LDRTVPKLAPNSNQYPNIETSVELSRCESESGLHSE